MLLEFIGISFAISLTLGAPLEQQVVYETLESQQGPRISFNHFNGTFIVYDLFFNGPVSLVYNIDRSKIKEKPIEIAHTDIFSASTMFTDTATKATTGFGSLKDSVFKITSDTTTSVGAPLTTFGRRETTEILATTTASRLDTKEHKTTDVFKTCNECEYPFIGIPLIKGSCFLFNSTRMTWFEAKAECVKLGSHLVIMDSELKNREVTKQARIYGNSWFWTDGFNANNQGDFRWNSTGEKFVYTNWYPGEPNSAFGDEPCVLANYGGDKWNDCSCVIDRCKSSYVCEKGSSKNC